MLQLFSGFLSIELICILKDKPPLGYQSFCCLCYVILHSRLNLRKSSSAEHSMWHSLLQVVGTMLVKMLIPFAFWYVLVFISPSLIYTIFKADSQFFLCIEFLHYEGKISSVAVQLHSRSILKLCISFGLRMLTSSVPCPYYLLGL